MAYIKSVIIEGFKKIKNLNLNFDPMMNILIGENETGKSSIIEAINIVLNQDYRNAEKSILKELFTLTNIKKFENSPCVETLPSIKITIVFEMSKEDGRISDFYGMENTYNITGYGITFECKFNDEFKEELAEEIKNKNVPYEYYQMTWITFAGTPYNFLKKAFKYLLIDNSSIDANNSYNYYNKTMFNNSYEPSLKMRYKNSFNNQINYILDDLKLNDINEKQKFGINSKKINLENVITIYQDNIPIENMGKGMENILKTKNALKKSRSNLNIISIEEPENHLSHLNLRNMIETIVNSSIESQLIITTHSNLVTNGLGLKKVIFLSNDNGDIKYTKFNSLDDKTQEFFIKADNSNLLQFILSKKVILVEGNTEYMLMPTIFEKVTNESINESGIDIISCGGISYKRYLEFALLLNKKTAVITDNDKKDSKISEVKDFNAKNKFIQIYLDESKENWTWEACIYNLNKVIMDSKIKIDPNADYLYKGNDYGKTLGYMLNNKTEVAYQILTNINDVVYPQYVKDAIKWIKE